MKKILILLFSLALLTSCHKKGVSLFTGDYSYKMSGSVVLEPVDDLSLEPLEFDITNEIGNMNISTLDRKDGTVMVVFNAINGELCATSARCTDKDIEFSEFEKTLRLTNIAQGINTNCKVEVSAEGTMYDDNTIIINAEFSGSPTYLDNVYSIQGDNIMIVAYRND